ncbi:hypothetical protein [Sphingomonas sp.]|jgi:pimeloyl-ACP methyl ester carboxylesterase|uniref:alpha/beta fold hydrolase n=1 Tax=Sphingomonas sp. TaxID=28214 RepID=UPI002EDA5BF3
MNEIAMAMAAEQEDARGRTITLFAHGEEDVAAIELLDAAYRRGKVEGFGEPANVVGVGKGAEAALAAAAASPGRVARLVLIAPQIPDQAPLASIETPTLVIIGSDDLAGAAQGRRCSEEMPSCYLMLVYAAGRDVAAARPEATATLIEQFLESGETFPVRTTSHMLHP